MTKDKLEEEHNCDILVCYHNNTKGLCCLYNPDNCKYRQLQKENVDLEEKISVLLSCKNCPENKGGLICQKEYENKCLAQKIQHIKELQEENAELKEKYDTCLRENTSLKIHNAYVEKKLTKAKDLLKQWLQTSKASGCDNINIVTDTEQFLISEVEK